MEINEKVMHLFIHESWKFFNDELPLTNHRNAIVCVWMESIPKAGALCRIGMGRTNHKPNVTDTQKENSFDD